MFYQLRGQAPKKAIFKLLFAQFGFEFRPIHQTITHFKSRAENYENNADEKSVTRAAIDRIEAGQAMIREGDIDDGLKLIEKNIELLDDKEKMELATRYLSSILSALIYQAEYSKAIPLAEDYLERAPIGYQHASDICSSRILAAVVGLRSEASMDSARLDEIDLADAARLNTEQWLLLSDSLEILKSESDKSGSSVYEFRDLISSLNEMCRNAVALESE